MAIEPRKECCKECARVIEANEFNKNKKNDIEFCANWKCPCHTKGTDEIADTILAAKKMKEEAKSPAPLQEKKCQNPWHLPNCQGQCGKPKSMEDCMPAICTCQYEEGHSRACPMYQEKPPFYDAKSPSEEGDSAFSPKRPLNSNTEEWED